MAGLITKSGGDPLIAPSLREIPLEENSEALLFGDRLFSGKVDMLIMLTGPGMNTLLSVLQTKYAASAIKNELSKIDLVSRGPKPALALRSFGLNSNVSVPEPCTWREILAALDEHAVKENRSLRGLRVAVQEYGVTNEEFLAGLKMRGAEVLRVPVYRWALPEDTEPLKRALDAVISGEVDVVIFTNAHQISNVMAVAKEHGLEEAFRKALKKAVVASIGPNTTAYLDEYGFPVDIEPLELKMESFVKEVSEQSSGILETKRFTSAGVSKAFEPSSPKNTESSLFLKACRREAVETTPIWLMRQAGRYLQSYRQLREKYSFLELCKNSDIAAEITVDAVTKLGVDAAIIFADILLIVEPMGLFLEYAQGDGPIIHQPVRSGKDLNRIFLPEKGSLDFVHQAIRKACAWLPSGIPLIGFSAAPFTLASYMIEGQITRNFIHTKSFMHRDFSAWSDLMNKIADALIPYLNEQISAGANAVQIFDSWVGCLSPSDYRHYVLPFSKKVIAGIQPGIPVIHFGTQTSELLELMKEAGGNVIGLDWRVELDAAWKRLGNVAVQGNLDPTVLFADQATIKASAERILKQANGRPGHIFNLGHGVLPETPLENVRYLIETVHRRKTGSRE